jgi:hypothetical protein
MILADYRFTVFQMPKPSAPAAQIPNAPLNTSEDAP